MADSQITLLLELAHTDAQAFECLSIHPKLATSAGFHAQQASEKALKAVLLAYAADFPLTHNLGLLWDLCAQHGVPCSVSKFDLVQLTPYAVEGRYTVLTEGISLDELRQTMIATLSWAEQTIKEKS